MYTFAVTPSLFASCWRREKPHRLSGGGAFCSRRRLLRALRLRLTLLAELRHGGSHLVRDFPLLTQGGDHRLRLLRLESERARLSHRLIEQRLLTVQALQPRLDLREHRFRARQPVLCLLELA